MLLYPVYDILKKQCHEENVSTAAQTDYSGHSDKTVN